MLNFEADVDVHTNANVTCGRTLKTRWKSRLYKREICTRSVLEQASCHSLSSLSRIYRCISSISSHSSFRVIRKVGDIGFFTASKRSCRKVVFSQVSLCPRGQGSPSKGEGGLPLGGSPFTWSPSTGVSI